MSKNATIMAVVNPKSGTDKTTTCNNLGIGLEISGKKILVIYTDPQASLTISLGYPVPDQVSLVNAMSRETIFRPDPYGSYEIISGYRRHHASELAGKETMPAIVCEMDDDFAIILMVDSNLQRETILPSERAYAYKMKLDAIKHQGSRTDLTSTQVVEKLSVEKIGDDDGVSKDTVRRYIRLTELIPEMMEMVDMGQIKFHCRWYP